MSAIINTSVALGKIQEAASGMPKHKNGETYVPLTIFVNDELDQYNNDSSVQISQTKEERDAKAPRVYVGNGRVAFVGEQGVTKKDTDGTPF